MDEAKIISLRKEPELLDMFCTYFSKNWGREVIYRNCMESSLSSDSPLPQWFLLVKKDEICGGCGLITNDFISRMDLYPWLCALFVEEKFRKQGLGGTNERGIFGAITFSANKQEKTGTVIKSPKVIMKGFNDYVVS